MSIALVVVALDTGGLNGHFDKGAGWVGVDVDQARELGEPAPDTGQQVSRHELDVGMVTVDLPDAGRDYGA